MRTDLRAQHGGGAVGWGVTMTTLTDGREGKLDGAGLSDHEKKGRADLLE